MAKFVYNNTKNASTDYTPFKFNYKYNLRVLFEDEIDFYLRPYSVNKLAKELRKLMRIYCQNLFHT